MVSTTTTNRPKRPLSAYNLFYRFKRSKILTAHENGDDSKETVNRLITAVPGLEDHPSLANTVEDSVNELRRNEIRSALLQNLAPKDTSKRSHRKSHGAVSFLEMNKIMCASWKAIDDFARSVFEELAEEGRGVYHKRVAEYEEKNPSQKKKIKSAASTEPSKDAVSPPSQATDAVKAPKEVKSEGKDPERPKRPLSSYNLFYRFKRSKVLEAHENGDFTKETINRLITAVPGLEEYPAIGTTMSPERVMELRRTEIRSALRENLSPKDTSKRTHRKSHGAMSFLEMNQLMCASWKAIDDFSRSVFDELAEEGRSVYHKRVAEYKGESPPAPKKKKIKMSHSIALALPKKPAAVMGTGPAPAAIIIPPMVNNYIAAPLVPPVPSVTPTSVASAFFGYLDQQPEPMPIFPDIFERMASRSEETTPLDYISDYSDTASSAATHTSRVFNLDDIPRLPLSNFEGGNHKSGEQASMDDFMRLIATLDD
ncbi:hypothetical protein ACHAXR_004239 [Thalassiosira sp. AJA248-18]